jgi:hypothetical protein
LKILSSEKYSFEIYWILSGKQWEHAAASSTDGILGEIN